MNAVNLIPSDRRARRAGISAGSPFYGLIAALAIALVATVLYVTAINRVDSRRAQLAQISAGVARWTAAANSYATYVRQSQQRITQLAEVRHLASARFDWSRLLGQLAALMPPNAALSSMQAAAPGASATPASTTSGSSAPGTGIQLTGCAASHSAVGETMVRLRRITGVASVTLTSSTKGSAGSGGAAGATSASAAPTGGACSLPVQFQVSLGFAAPASASTAPAPGTSAATATSGATSPSTTTSSSTTPSTAASSGATASSQ